MEFGYIYCFSNQCMFGLLNIGATLKNPETELLESNDFDKWRPPTPYKIEFIKKVSNPFQKEKTLHTILSQHTKRVNPDRNFFRVGLGDVKELFDLMDEVIEKEEISSRDEDEKEEINSRDADEKEEINSDEEINRNDDDEDEIKHSSKPPKLCRDMTKCFTDGQPIRHTARGTDSTWTCTYNLSKNNITHNGKSSSLNQFVKSHYELKRKDRTSAANAWSECECEINGKWKSIFNLPILV
jgi:hypothetical protein